MQQAPGRAADPLVAARLVEQARQPLPDGKELGAVQCDIGDVAFSRLRAIVRFFAYRAQPDGADEKHGRIAAP